MGFDVYHRHDITHILRGVLAADQAVQVAHEPTERSEGYHAGFLAALVAVGLAVGLEPREERESVRFVEAGNA